MDVQMQGAKKAKSMHTDVDMEDARDGALQTQDPGHILPLASSRDGIGATGDNSAGTSLLSTKTFGVGSFGADSSVFGNSFRQVSPEVTAVATAAAVMVEARSLSDASNKNEEKMDGQAQESESNPTHPSSYDRVPLFSTISGSTVDPNPNPNPNPASALIQPTVTANININVNDNSNVDVESDVDVNDSDEEIPSIDMASDSE
jgi:hypothetical protein